jgi:hypothetical protein
MWVDTEVEFKDYQRHYIFIDVVKDLIRTGSTRDLSKPSGRNVEDILHVYNNDKEQIELRLIPSGYKIVYIYRLPCMSPKDNETAKEIVSQLSAYFSSINSIHVSCFDSEEYNAIINLVAEKVGPIGESLFISSSGIIVDYENISNSLLLNYIQLKKRTVEEYLSETDKETGMIYITICDQISLEKIIPRITESVGDNYQIVNMDDSSTFERCVGRVKDILVLNDNTNRIFVCKNKTNVERKKWDTLLNIMKKKHKFLWVIGDKEEVNYCRSFETPIDIMNISIVFI